MKALTMVVTIFDRAVDLMAILAMVMLAFTCLSVSLDVALRKMFGIYQIWVIEINEYILIYAARHYMPFGLGLLFMVTVVGIIVSTADSHLLVPATTFINDVYRTYINPKAKEKHVVFVSRCLVLFFGVIAYLVTHAFSESTGFFKKALYAYTIYGSAITPSLIAAMFWKRATKAGAIASIATGIVVTLLWKQVDFFLSILPESFQQLNAVKVCQELDAVLPAITLSALALWVVSLSTGKRTRS